MKRVEIQINPKFKSVFEIMMKLQKLRRIEHFFIAVIVCIFAIICLVSIFDGLIIGKKWYIQLIIGLVYLMITLMIMIMNIILLK